MGSNGFTDRANEPYRNAMWSDYYFEKVEMNLSTIDSDIGVISDVEKTILSKDIEAIITREDRNSYIFNRSIDYFNRALTSKLLHLRFPDLHPNSRVTRVFVEPYNLHEWNECIDGYPAGWNPNSFQYLGSFLSSRNGHYQVWVLVDWVI